MIAAHNAGGHAFRLGVNQFSDLTQREFAAAALSPAPMRIRPEAERNVVLLPPPPGAGAAEM